MGMVGSMSHIVRQEKPSDEGFSFEALKRPGFVKAGESEKPIAKPNFLP